jgi:hypothetical protein
MRTNVREIRSLCRTELWRSLLKRSFSDRKIVWALDVEDLMYEVDRFAGDAAIIELDTQTVAADCHKVLQTTSYGCQTRFFAVGNESLNAWLPLIRICGFSDWCLKLTDFDRFQNRIGCYRDSRQEDALSIERWVELNLPWQPLPDPPINSPQSLI